ncbi:MAG: hypothetical protein WB787_03550, partial [Candidatus Acidiferrales bacterium]
GKTKELPEACPACNVVWWHNTHRQQSDYQFASFRIFASKLENYQARFRFPADHETVKKAT